MLGEPSEVEYVAARDDKAGPGRLDDVGGDAAGQRIGDRREEPGEVFADGDVRDRFTDLAVVDELLGGGQLAGVDEPLDVRCVDRRPSGRLLHEPLEPILKPPRRLLTVSG